MELCMKITIPLFYFWCVFIVFQSFNCKQADGDTTTNISDPVTEAVKLTSEGWRSFEAKDYSKAITLFKQALDNNDLYADAYNGLGWTYGRQDSLKRAKIYFDIALGLEKGNTDAIAGRSFVSLGLGNYDDAISAVTLVEENQVVYYTFRHDRSISINDLKLVKAQSYFMLGNYSESQTIIDELDPQNQLDQSKASYIEDLALAIENLWKTI